MRSFGTRRSGAIMATIAISAVTFIAAGASAATIVMGAVHANLGSSFPDPATWALMLLSFGLIGAGTRARKRSVVLS